MARRLGVRREFTPIKDLTMEVKEGEFLSISGPNGSGKTSLLRTMSGLMEPVSGKVWRRSERLGFVSQSQVLLPELTIRENVLLPFSLAREKHQDGKTWLATMDIEDVLGEMHDLVDRFKIDGILDKHPHTCSVGQQQRALLVRALITDSEIIFADEPEQNLDSDGRIQLFEVFKEANEVYGRTVVLVTQEHLDVIKRYVTRAVKIVGHGIEVVYEK